MGSLPLRETSSVLSRVSLRHLKSRTGTTRRPQTSPVEPYTAHDPKSGVPKTESYVPDKKSFKGKKRPSGTHYREKDGMLNPQGIF